MDNAPHERVAQLVDLTLSLVRSMVNDENAVICKPLVGRHNVILEVYVHPGDVGIVIGTEGLHVKALRTILNVACKKLDLKFHLEIAGNPDISLK